MSDAVRLSVGVLTFRRNDDLREILPMLLVQLDSLGGGVTADVLVVDNDASGSARPVVASLADPRVRYANEPRPGIAAARNRALDECVDRDVLVFIDDDERPTDGWLARLVEVFTTSGAAAVAGPVRSEFLGVPDRWLEAGGFFARRHRIDVPTGTSIEMAATNNLLLDLRRVREFGLRFPEEVGLAGGEDNLFTGRLTRAGGAMVWCADAWVTETVPADRATRRWALLRSLSSGNSLAHVNLRLASNLRATLVVRIEFAGGGLARIVAGGGRYALGCVTMRVVHQARGLRLAARGAGMLLGAFGYTYEAYRRAKPAPLADRAAASREARA